MSVEIKIVHGKETDLPTLSEAQPALTTDTKRVLIGTDSGNLELLTKNSLKKGSVTLDSDGEADIVTAAVELDSFIQLSPPAGLGNMIIDITAEIGVGFHLKSRGGSDDAGLTVGWMIW